MTEAAASVASTGDTPLWLGKYKSCTHKKVNGSLSKYWMILSIACRQQDDNNNFISLQDCRQGGGGALGFPPSSLSFPPPEFHKNIKIMHCLVNFYGI